MWTYLMQLCKNLILLIAKVSQRPSSNQAAYARSVRVWGIAQ
ncbi:MAG: hypothetical protein ACFB2W_00805 [Leptolyngbyaceae cyanobacterium]